MEQPSTVRGVSKELAHLSNLSERLKPVVQETQELTKRFADAGYRLFLVGGIVRDALLGLRVDEACDLDLTTDAQPTATKQILEGWADALWTQGERFGTIGAHRHNRRVEITTHRTEHYQPGSRKPDVVFAEAIEADLSRRDFTINAMAVELPQGDLVDPFGGAADLAARRLRTPLEPANTFSDDPLRMLRAARFLAQFQLHCTQDVVEAIQQTAERLSIVAHERIRAELDRLLALADPVPGFGLLFSTGLAERVVGPIDDPQRALRGLSHAGSSHMVRLTVLMSGVGSPDGVRAALVERHFTKDVKQTVPTLLKLAQAALNNPPQNLSELRRWIVGAHSHHQEALEVAAALDTATALNEAAALGDAKPSAIDKLARDVAALLQAEPDLLGPPVLDGKQIMAHLNLPPGPQVGKAVAELHRYRLEAGPLTPSEAYKHLSKWHTRPLAPQPPHKT